MKNSSLIFLFVCIISCTSNTIYEKPKDLIPKEQMVALLTDLYLAHSAKPYRNTLNERNIDYTFLVYEKYGIDSARFKSSNFYYTTKIDDYEKIYQEVEKNISTLNTNFKAIKKVKDSIRRDSIQKIRFTKDSIQKIEIRKDSLVLDIINQKMKDSTNWYDLKKVKSLRRTLNMDSLRRAHPLKEADTIPSEIDSLQENAVGHDLQDN